MLFITLILLSLFGVSMFGAYLSIKVRNGLNPLATYISSLASSTLWIFIIIGSKKPLASLSLFFDVVLSLGYLVGFLLMAGEPITKYQAIGIGAALCAIVFLNL